MRRIVICLLLLFITASPAGACIGARYAGIGWCGVAVADDATASYWNPVAIVWANEPAQNNITSEKQGFWASRDPWTKEDTYWQIGVLVTLIIDWGQTREIATNPAYYETNPVLGKYPTLQEVDRYFIACIVGNYLIAKALPKNWRRKWQVGSILVQTYYINNNYKLGIKMNF